MGKVLAEVGFLYPIMILALIIPVAGPLHLYSETPLFKRAILLSGLAGLLPPRPVDVQDLIYHKTCEKLDFSDLPPSQRAGRMLNLPAVELAKIAFQVEICPTSDGEFIPTTEWIRHENFKPLPEWCDSLVIGSYKDEVLNPLLPI